MLKGVLLDFNGTLFYDSDKHIRAFQLFFINRGLEAPDADYIAKMTFGRTNDVIFRDIYKADASDEELAAYDIEKEELYRTACLESPETLKLAKGAEEMLDFLAENGIPFCIATGSGIDNINFYFEYLGIAKWFDIDRIVYNDGSFKCKPAPDIYIEAAKRIGRSPEECIVFEDGTSGILSANAAGVGAVVAVVSPELESPVRDGAVADCEVSDFETYKDIFKKYRLI